MGQDFPFAKFHRRLKLKSWRQHVDEIQVLALQKIVTTWHREAHASEEYCMTLPATRQHGDAAKSHTGYSLCWKCESLNRGAGGTTWSHHLLYRKMMKTG